MSDKFNRFFTSSFKIKTVYASSCSLHSKNPSSHRNSITRNEYLATNVCSCTASPSMNSTNGNLSSTGEDNIFNLADYFLFNLDKNIQIYEVSKKWHHSSNFMKDIDVAVQQSPHKDRDKNRKFTPVHSSTP
jgi:hypothetical protein